MATNELIKECPKCKGMLKLRSGKFGQFYGCSNYPKCKHTEKVKFEKQEIVLDTKSFVGFNPSIYQKNVADYFLNKSGNVFCFATAGSGKTTLALYLMSLVDYSCRYLAFNGKIVTDVQPKLNNKDKAQTVHSLGLSILKQYFGYVKVSSKKDNKIDRDTQFLFDILDKEDYFLIHPILKFVGGWKNTFPVDKLDDDQIKFILEKFHIETNGNQNRIIDLAHKTVENGLKNRNIVTFDDMIFLPVLFNLQNKEEINCVFVDEAQDLSPTQRLVLKLINAKRYVFVGDVNQSIYAFRGADFESIQAIISEFDCEQFPLSISYRNPKSICQLVNSMFQEIAHYASDDAIEGNIENITVESLYFKAQAKDLILCRVNRFLVDIAISMAKQGKSVIILGRDICNDICNIIAKVNTWNLTELQEKVLEIQDKTKSMEISDYCDIILDLIEKFNSVQAIIDAVQSLFSDFANENAIVFSTVHKAKGAEAKNVYILFPELFPHPKAETEAELLQERNLLFVAITRTLENLYFVKGS
jgi:DNA helicase II / ATP-dependent DNA helicase PcrA